MNYQEFRIVELCSNGVENLNDEEIAELFLLEEEEAMSTCISPMLQHYSRYFCKRPTRSDPEKDGILYEIKFTVMKFHVKHLLG